MICRTSACILLLFYTCSIPFNIHLFYLLQPTFVVAEVIKIAILRQHVEMVSSIIRATVVRGSLAMAFIAKVTHAAHICYIVFTTTITATTLELQFCCPFL